MLSKLSNFITTVFWVASIKSPLLVDINFQHCWSTNYWKKGFPDSQYQNKNHFSWNLESLCWCQETSVTNFFVPLPVSRS
jgi:hypothetical protein